MRSSQEPRHDDFDMAKLQKSLRQQHQQSLRLRGTVTKLTPAEIRSLNNSATASKGTNRSSSTRSHEVRANTPPLTPDNVVPTQHSTPGRNSLSLPTPPQSPDDAIPQRQNSNTGNGTHIYSPIPQSHSKAGFVLATNNSRPPSASSHRGMPTYRGPEVTKRGSVSMLQPSMMTHQIVDNPLSQFSRPRQARGSISPTRQEQRQRTPSVQSDARSQRSQSLSARNTSSEQPRSPPDLTGSPISAIENEPGTTLTARSVELTKPVITRVQTVAVDGPVSSEPHSRFSWQWRKSLSGHRDEKMGDVEMKKSRRRSLSFGKGSQESVQSIAYEDTKSGAAPQHRDSLKGDLPSSKSSLHNTMLEAPSGNTAGFAAHPAVRPLSAMEEARPEATGKGKEREVEQQETHDVFADDSVPMYSRCSCCGKLKKPSVNRALSPVLENENLRTNFSMEIERTDNPGSGRRRSSSSASRQRYTPIIPMILAQGNTVQAKIAPRSQDLVQQTPEVRPIVNGTGDIIANGSEPVTVVSKTTEDKDKKMVRFSSLHLREELQRQMNNNKMAVDDGISRNHVGMRNYVPAGTTGVELTYRSLSSVPHSPTSEATTGESMAATNGVDSSFTQLSVGEQSESTVQAKSDTANQTHSANERSHQSRGESRLEPGTALTIHHAVTQRPLPPNSATSKTNSRSVSFEPTPVEHNGAIKSSVSESVKQRSQAGHNSNPPYQNARNSTYRNFSTRGFITRPRATAQYMLNKDSSVQNTNSTNASSSTKSTVGSTSSESPLQTETTSTTPLFTFNTGLSSLDQDDRSFVDDDDNERTSSFGLLPVPQFGKHFGESNATFGNFVLPDDNKSRS